MENKKVLFLLQFFYPEYVSSATLPFDTASRLSKEGYQVDVLCGYPHEYSDNENVLECEVINDINIRRIKYLQLSRKQKIGRLVNYLSLTVAMFCQIFTMKKYDVIFVYSNPPILPLVAALARILFGVKLVFIAYDLYPEIAIRTNVLSEKSLIAKFMNYINKVVFSHASAVVALSSEMKRYIANNREIESEKIFVIPNWYEDEYLENNKDPNNRFYSQVDGRFVVSYFGNMGIAQDMDSIKKSIMFYKNDPDVCFLLAGHGIKHEEIRCMIEKEHITNAYIFGFLKGNDYLDALRITDVAIVSLSKGLTGLCVPSKTYGYMMQGLPIIAIMDESDILNDLKNGAGYYVDEHTNRSLNSIIMELKNNPDDCIKRGKISREIYLKNYTKKVCLEKYIELMKLI